jgi:hypothetical protein
VNTWRRVGVDDGSRKKGVGIEADKFQLRLSGKKKRSSEVEIIR